MDTRKGSIIVGLLLCLITALTAPQGAIAAGTPACTSIGNTATVSFNVGGFAQTPVSSPTNTIVVGNRVDVIVTTTDSTPGPAVVSNQSDVLLHFTITNNGNASQQYALTAVNVATGVTTSVFVGNNTVTDVDLVSAGTATTGNAAGGALVTTPTVTPDGTLTVTIKATMAGSLPNNAYDVFALRAVTLKTDGSPEAAADPGVIDPAGLNCSAAIVLGDGAGTNDVGAGARDGSHSARSAYHSVLTSLTVNKTSIVYSDPFTVFPNAKAIPGAVMQYTVAVTNSAGGSTAQSVAISDTLTATLAPVNPLPDGNCTGCVGACVEHPATTFTCRGGWAGQTLSATDATDLVSGATTTFVYRATIQ